MYKNIEVRAYERDDLSSFIKMFTTYFRDDFKIDIDDEALENLCKKITEDVMKDIVQLSILLVDEKYAGFINYQIDSKSSNWCEREGWGFIREAYIDKAYRGQGLGKVLVDHVEMYYEKQGISNIYLTSDEHVAFWMSRGYQPTGIISTINNDPIYEKIK